MRVVTQNDYIVGMPLLTLCGIAVSGGIGGGVANRDELVASIDACYKKFGFTRKRSIVMADFKREMSEFQDVEFRSEHLLYMAKFFQLNICVVDFTAHTREDFVGNELKPDAVSLFKKGGPLADAAYALYVGPLGVLDKIKLDLQSSPLFGSNKPSHIKKLAKMVAA
jgi:hypothetical protein